MERRVITKKSSPLQKKSSSPSQSNSSKKGHARINSGNWNQPNVFKQQSPPKVQRPLHQRIKSEPMNELKGVQNPPVQEQMKEEQKISLNRRLTMMNDKNIPIRTGSPKRSSPFSQKTKVNGIQVQQQSEQQISESGDNVVQAVSFKTATGKIPGTNKVNQDAYIMTSQIRKLPYLHFYSVCDGHGQCGREVSSFIKSKLPTLLSQDPNIESDGPRALRTCIGKVSQELSRQNFDVQFSGSTLVSVLINKKVLWCANVGDSRAILVKNESVVALSRDHKPELKEEAERIISNKDEYGKDVGPLRVWLAEADLPGLAMTRSVGDTIAKVVGVTSDPEILEFNLVPEDQYIIIASDGVWEFISNEEAAKITKPYVNAGQLQNACDALAKESNKRWTAEEEVIDDITCVIIKLNV